MIPPEQLEVIGGAGPWVTAIGGIGTALTLTNIVSLPHDQQNIAIGTSIAILIGGIIMLAAYHFTIDQASDDPMVQDYAMNLMAQGLTQGDPEFVRLMQQYKGIPEYQFSRRNLQILPQSDVLTLDKNAWRYTYKYGSWPGYDPSPYQAYDAPPQWGTDPYFFDPFGLRTSDFDAKPLPFDAYPPYPNPYTNVLGYTYSTSV